MLQERAVSTRFTIAAGDVLWLLPNVQLKDLADLSNSYVLNIDIVDLTFSDTLRSEAWKSIHMCLN
jgi:hypothetical protein